MSTSNDRHRVILAATDFSPAAERALEWAVALAAKRRAELVLLHVFVSPATDWPLELQEPIAAQLLDVTRTRLEHLSLPLRQRVPALRCEVRSGAPAEVIVGRASALSAELIVMGTRGLRGWRHLLLGSTAERVLEHAACPVLTVHEADAAPAAEPWRALVGTDFSKDSMEALRAAARLLGPHLGRVTLIHVFQTPALAAPPDAMTVFDLAEAAREAAHERLDEIVEEQRQQGLAIDGLLYDGYPPATIAEVARERAVELVVTGTRGHGGLSRLLLGSCAERVAQLANRPLLAVPRRAWQAGTAMEEAPALVGAGVDDLC
jgi:nucleotide-binding universal stress UspA family protein